MISLSGHIRRAKERKVCLQHVRKVARSSLFICVLLISSNTASGEQSLYVVPCIFQSFGRSDTAIKLSFMSKEVPLIESPLPLVPACGSVYSSVPFHSCSPRPLPPPYSICCSCSHCLCSVSLSSSLSSLYSSDSLSAANASIKVS